jgi:hypothetical protein
MAVGFVVAGGAAAWVWWAYQLPDSERRDELLLPGFVLAVAGVLVGVVSLLVRPDGRSAARSVDVLARRLAQAVDMEWRREAHERRLLPDPIPIRWSLSNLAVAGPVAAAVGAPQERPAFAPLPGQARISEADLRAGGRRRELHQLYAGLASGRIVVIGAPGAGKSGAAILLLLDALAHRDELSVPQRSRVPVPVLFTAHGWDPATTARPRPLSRHRHH